MIKKPFFSICVLFLSWPLAASDLAEIEERGTLRMLCFPHIESTFVRPDLDVLRASGRPLEELHDPAAYSGLDVEIVTAFAESLGVDLHLVPVVTTYGDLIEALVEGRGDLVASSLTITEERSRRVDFSVPYLQSFIVVGVPVGSEIRSIEDLSGRRGAVMRGSSQLEYLKKLEIADLELVFTDYSLENFEALDEGRADFALFDSAAEPGEPVIGDLDGAIVAFRLRSFDYGIALPPGSDLKHRLDRFLADLRSSGRLEKMVAAHQP